MEHEVLYNSGELAGQQVELNEREQRIADFNQEICNSLGYEINITTLTMISKKVVEQKFFTIAPADYYPVVVGEGAWSTSIQTFREFSTAGDFEEGFINLGENNSRLADADAGVDSVNLKVKNWAKVISYSIFELESAQRNNNWSVIEAKERSRKKNWDLGVQRTAFLGARNDSSVKGLLTLTSDGVNANTALLDGYIKDMNATDFQAFLSDVMGAYRSNSNYTSNPDRFIIPELDYDGLAATAAENFPNKSKLQRLLEVFRAITGNQNFQILRLAYADQVNNADVSGLNKNRYTLLNSDPDSVNMYIPIDYTNTLANTVNNIQYQGGAYGQVTGAQALRPLEMLYLDWAA